ECENYRALGECPNRILYMQYKGSIYEWNPLVSDLIAKCSTCGYNLLNRTSLASHECTRSKLRAGTSSTLHQDSSVGPEEALPFWDDMEPTEAKAETT